MNLTVDRGELSTSSGTTGSSVTATADADGQVVVYYHAPSSVSSSFTESVRATMADSFDSFDGTTLEDEEIPVTVSKITTTSPHGISASVDSVDDGSAGEVFNLLPGLDDAEYRVAWSVTDEAGDVNDLVVQLVRRDSGANPVVDSVTYAANGETSLSGTAELAGDGGAGDDYIIRVMVSDRAGQTASDSATDTADGSDPAT